MLKIFNHRQINILPTSKNYYLIIAKIVAFSIFRVILLKNYRKGYFNNCNFNSIN